MSPLRDALAQGRHGGSIDAMQMHTFDVHADTAATTADRPAGDVA